MTSSETDNPKRNYKKQRIEFWDFVAEKMDRRFNVSDYYHRRLEQIYKFRVPPNQRVLEIGCGQGDLLAAVKPAVGIGVDFSGKMVERARQKHPELRFIQADAHDLHLEKSFDVIICAELINDLWDVQSAFEQIAKLCVPRTRIVLNFFSHVWEMPLFIARQWGLATPVLEQNWLSIADVTNLLNLAGLEVVHCNKEILWPVKTPFGADFCNKFLVKFWPFNLGALTNFMVVRPKAEPPADPPKVSVIVPARNEAGNIPGIIERVPEMGRGSELIFVEGHSTDDTYETIKKALADLPADKYKLLRQTGAGKGDAVRLGFSQAGGDVLMILDADMTVPPEDLPKFYTALVSGKGEFINGVRLVYPMESEAMRYLNLAGNKFFSLAFSWLLGQPIKDTLCGTKVLWKKDYDLIAENRSYFGDFDPFGDFDLLFGAVKLNLKIAELPIRYRERTYGSTNIQRWKHGWLLLKMVVFASLRIKFK